jgi:ankyrin repeat protein
MVILLDAGADVNARNSHGRTPLHNVSAVMSETKIIIVLLDAGADVNARDSNGYTPLHLASMYGSPDNVMALLQAGADGTLKESILDATPWDLAQSNHELKDTAAYWALNDARFK